MLSTATRLLLAGLTAAALVAPGGLAWADAPSRTGDGAVRTIDAQVAPAVATVDPPASTAKVVVPMVFPVVGAVSYHDTFLACRSGCTRRHLGQDLMGRKMQMLIAAFDGTVSYVHSASDGNYFSVRSLDNRWTVNYLHVNNDTPGTDDGRGSANNAFLPGLKVGNRVVRGQLLGWLGDSGNAESVGPHLHFELRQGDAWSGTVYNPIYSLNAAPRAAGAITAAPHQPGELLHYGAAGTMFLLMADGTRRSVPPTMMAANGWVARDVLRVSSGELALYPLAGVAALRDGSIVAGPDGTRWATAGGRRYSVTASDLTAMGLSISGAVPVAADALVGTPVATGPVPGGRFRAGAFVRITGDSQIWLVDRGTRKTVCMCTWAWWSVAAGQVAVLPAGAFTDAGAPPTGPMVSFRDGTMFQAPTLGTYIMVAGARRRITDLRALGYYNWGSKQHFWLYDNLTAALPLGPPIA